MGLVERGITAASLSDRAIESLKRSVDRRRLSYVRVDGTLVSVRTRERQHRHHEGSGFTAAVRSGARLAFGLCAVTLFACASPIGPRGDASVDAHDSSALVDLTTDAAPDVIQDPLDAGDPRSCTFAAIQSNVLVTCGGAGCHTATGSAGQLALDAPHAYANLVGVSSSIVPGEMRIRAGDPDHSFAWRKLTNRLDPSAREGSPMPLDEGLTSWLRLTPEQLRLVYCWILAGAQDN